MNNKLWGGRFAEDLDTAALNYTETTAIDHRLLPYDIWGSIAHVLMLMQMEIVAEFPGRRIVQALRQLLEAAEKGEVTLDPSLEDVHFNIESLVIGETGQDIGGCLHTARSRNDQVVTDTRMYVRQYLLEIEESVEAFACDLVAMSRQHTGTIAVGYTHVQAAQPVSYGFWLGAYASMMVRDLRRVRSAYETTNKNVLGSCALAGTSFAIDRDVTTDLLGFDGVFEHALDGTSSRDFCAEALSALALLATNLSRMAEEIVVWSSFEYSLIEVDDAFATGSSIMPQKKNPVIAELAKGKAGRVTGALAQSLMYAKGVMTGYNCDLQEDKPLLWDALDTTLETVRIMHRQLESASYNSDRAMELNWRNFSTATELANFLVNERNWAFRDAHKVVGELTYMLQQANKDLRDESAVLNWLAARGVEMDQRTYQWLVDPSAVVRRQTSKGATAPERVEEMASNIENELDELACARRTAASRLEECYRRSKRIADSVASGEPVASALGANEAGAPADPR